MQNSKTLHVAEALSLLVCCFSYRFLLICVPLHLLCILFTLLFSSSRLTLMQCRFHGSNTQWDAEQHKHRLQLTRAGFLMFGGHLEKLPLLFPLWLFIVPFPVNVVRIFPPPPLRPPSTTAPTKSFIKTVIQWRAWPGVTSLPDSSSICPSQLPGLRQS